MQQRSKKFYNVLFFCPSFFLLSSQAKPLFLQSQNIHEDLGNSNCVAQAMTNLGNIMLHTGQPQEALEEFSQAMEVSSNTESFKKK